MKKILITLSIVLSSSIYAGQLDNLSINTKVFTDIDEARVLISKKCSTFRDQREMSDFHYEIIDMDKVKTGLKVKWFCQVF